MADELDVDAMLEAPFQKEEEPTHTSRTVSNEKENGHGKESRKEGHEKDRSDGGKHRSRSRDRTSKRKRSRSRDRKRSKSRDKKRSRSRDKDRRHKTREVSRERRDRDRRSPERVRERRKSRSRSRDKDRRRRRSRSKDRRTSKSRDRRRASRSRSRDRRRNRSRSGSRTKPKRRELTAEERDARTVFCMQLSARIKARELEDFFSVVGTVTDVRIITDAKTRRSKGIAYVEFEDVESVPLALGLGGQKLLGVPIVVQPTLAERNRAANAAAGEEGAKSATGPMRLYVGSLHFNITEDMLRGIFEPFGKIDLIQLIMDTDTGRSKGYGFVTFHNAEDAKKALEQLNGFELAGRPMKVNHVTDRNDANQMSSLLDSDEKERTGVELDDARFHYTTDATARLSLMAKLAEGTDLKLPQAAVNALNAPAVPAQQLQTATPAIATQCFLLSNMFDPKSEQSQSWADEIRDDVIQECNKHGGVMHVFVDKQSAQGNVYVKCPSIATAVNSVNALHGRWFAGKMITAAYVPVMSYHSLFPDAMPITAPISI